MEAFLQTIEHHKALLMSILAVLIVPLILLLSRAALSARSSVQTLLENGCHLGDIGGGGCNIYKMVNGETKRRSHKFGPFKKSEIEKLFESVHDWEEFVKIRGDGDNCSFTLKVKKFNGDECESFVDSYAQVIVIAMAASVMKIVESGFWDCRKPFFFFQTGTIRGYFSQNEEMCKKWYQLIERHMVTYRSHFPELFEYHYRLLSNEQEAKSGGVSFNNYLEGILKTYNANGKLNSHFKRLVAFFVGTTTTQSSFHTCDRGITNYTDSGFASGGTQASSNFSSDTVAKLLDDKKGEDILVFFLLKSVRFSVSAMLDEVSGKNNSSVSKLASELKNSIDTRKILAIGNVVEFLSYFVSNVKDDEDLCNTARFLLSVLEHLSEHNNTHYVIVDSSKGKPLSVGTWTEKLTLDDLSSSCASSAGK
jgi:hypothetical protein